MSIAIRFIIQKKSTYYILVKIILFFLLISKASAQTEPVEFFSKPFSVEYEEVIAEQINGGIDGFLTEHTKVVTGKRETFWNRRFESVQGYNKSVETNRNHLREMIGAQKVISDVNLVRLCSDDVNNVEETTTCTIHEVEWTVLEGLKAQGLLLIPKGEIKASVVVIPDADELPEAYAGLQSGPDVALQLAERGLQVLIPTLINRDTRYSGNDRLTPGNPWIKDKDVISRWTNETHREWIWRQGFVMGKHIVGMEVQKVLAGVEWLKEDMDDDSQKIGVMGYGEGGLIALYAAALDTRIDAAWISGYFGSRKDLWSEPVYRDVWGILTEFGDAEIASLVTPRSLIIEVSDVPDVKEPLPPKERQSHDALPGELKTPTIHEIDQEVNRLKDFFPGDGEIKPDISVVSNLGRHGTREALEIFAIKLDVLNISESTTSISRYDLYDPELRQKRVFYNMQEYLQDMIPTAPQRRYDFLKGDYSSPESWEKDMEPYRQQFYKEMVGKIDQELLPLNPKVRQIYDEPGWKGYEVALETWPGVYAWGILAVPKDIKPGEKRPAVVLQHGIGGLPTTAILVESYHRVLPALVNRGFVVFAPYNPYQFNIRKAHAIKANAFSVIIPQYEQILNFLQSHESVDGSRIALYGKSWGGRTALRVPIVLKGFKVSICNAYYNDWLNKVVSVNYANSYFYENSIGIYNWNMGNTFTHAEMAQLIAPRPFMVVAGYMDGVAAHEMVASEFEKAKRTYFMMGIPERAQIEFFNGGHEINGQGAFRFLHKYLDWPEPKNPSFKHQISD